MISAALRGLVVGNSDQARSTPKQSMPLTQGNLLIKRLIKEKNQRNDGDDLVADAQCANYTRPIIAKKRMIITNSINDGDNDNDHDSNTDSDVSGAIGRENGIDNESDDNNDSELESGGSHFDNDNDNDNDNVSKNESDHEDDGYSNNGSDSDDKCKKNVETSTDGDNIQNSDDEYDCNSDKHTITTTHAESGDDIIRRGTQARKDLSPIRSNTRKRKVPADGIRKQEVPGKCLRTLEYRSLVSLSPATSVVNSDTETTNNNTTETGSKNSSANNKNDKAPARRKAPRKPRTARKQPVKKVPVTAFAPSPQGNGVYVAPTMQVRAAVVMAFASILQGDVLWAQRIEMELFCCYGSDGYTVRAPRVASALRNQRGCGAVLSLGESPHLPQRSSAMLSLANDNVASLFVHIGGKAFARCSRCKGGNISTERRNKRGGDEGQDTFCECLDCGMVWHIRA